MKGCRHHLLAALRRLAVGAAVLGAVTACATSPGSGPAKASDPAPSTSSGSVPAAPVVRSYSPYAADGRVAAAVARRVSGECWTTSVAAPSPNTYRCLADNEILDPCFAPPRRPDAGTLVCVVDPWSAAVVLTLATPLPAAAELPVVRAWALELANGARCTAVTGTVRTLDGIPLTYACGAGSAAGTPTPDTAPTTVEYGPTEGPLTRIGVTTVWRT